MVSGLIFLLSKTSLSDSAASQKSVDSNLILVLASPSLYHTVTQRGYGFMKDLMPAIVGSTDAGVQVAQMCF